jgi:HSP20 family protein
MGYRVRIRKETLIMKNLIPIRRNRSPVLFGGFDLDRFFEDFFERPFSGGFFSGETIPLDLYEKDNKVVVKAELPGINPEELELSVEGDILFIRAEKKHENEVKEKDCYRLERSYGAFQRAVGLPYKVKGEEATATYKKGVLEVHLPKTEQEKKNTIKINVK